MLNSRPIMASQLYITSCHVSCQRDRWKCWLLFWFCWFTCENCLPFQRHFIFVLFGVLFYNGSKQLGMGDNRWLWGGERASSVAQGEKHNCITLCYNWKFTDSQCHMIIRVSKACMKIISWLLGIRNWIVYRWWQDTGRERWIQQRSLTGISY